MTAITTLPTTERPQHKRGAEGAFLAVVRPQTVADTTDAAMCELRALGDYYATHHADSWLAAVALLRDLDTFDQQHAAGLLDADAYARLVEERYRGAPIATWLAAAGIARLVDRLITHRQGQRGA